MNGSPLSLTQSRILQGRWEGVLECASGQLPMLTALHDGRPLDGLTVTPVPGRTGMHAVTLPIPAGVLTQGVQTILFMVGDETLAQVTLVVGVPLEEDIRAELGLLRAELDLLKRAFRRHCSDVAHSDAPPR